MTKHVARVIAGLALSGGLAGVFAIPAGGQETPTPESTSTTSTTSTTAVTPTTETPPTTAPWADTPVIGINGEVLWIEGPGPCPSGTRPLNAGDGAVAHITDPADQAEPVCVNYFVDEEIPGSCPGAPRKPGYTSHLFTSDGECHAVSDLLGGPCDPATSPAAANAHVIVEGVSCTDYDVGAGPCPTHPESGGTFHALNLVDGTCAAVASASVAGVQVDRPVAPSTPAVPAAAPAQLPRTGFSRTHMVQLVGLAVALVLLGTAALRADHRARRPRC